MDSTGRTLLIVLIALLLVYFLKILKTIGDKRKEFQQSMNSNPIQFAKDADTSTPQKQSFCTSCGAKLKEGAKFCTSCGNSVSILGQNVSPIQQFRQTVPTQNSIQNVNIRGKYLSTAQRILNVVSEDQVLDTFSYSDGMVLIKTQGGKTIHAPLYQLSVCFQYIQATEQRMATIKYQGKKIEFIEAPTSINEAKTSTILDVLLKAGTVYGADSITPESITKAKQIKSQQMIRGFYMGQMMRRW